MIIIHSAHKRKDTPLTTQIAQKKIKTQRNCNAKNPRTTIKINQKRRSRINRNVRSCTSQIEVAVRNSDELYEILKNMSSLKKNKGAREIYKIIQSIHKRSGELEVKHQKMDIKTQLLEEITEDLQKIVNLASNLRQLKEDDKLGCIEEILQEISLRIKNMNLYILKIQNEDNPNDEIRLKIRNSKEEKVKSRRKKSKVKLSQHKGADRRSAKTSAIGTIRKLIPLCEKFKITLPEMFSEIKEMTAKQYREKEKLISGLLLENIDNIKKELEKEVNDKNLNEQELEELQEQEREMRMLDERTKQHYFRISNNPPITRIKKNKSSPAKLLQRSGKLRSYRLHSTKLFKKLEESCETLQESLSSESEQHNAIQEIKKNIENTKTIIKDNIEKYKKSFRKKLYYLEEIIKNMGDIIEKIQGMAEKEDQREKIKLEVARELLLNMEKRFLEMIIITDEIDRRPSDTEIEKKLEEIDPGFKDRKEEIDEEKSDMISELEDLEEDIFLEENYEELSLKSQVSNDYIDELSYNPIAKLKTHIDHDPMEQEEQSITIKAIGNEIRSKRDIGLEIDFSEASKSSDENSDEDLYDRGPYKKVKKKNYVESNYIEEDEL